MQIRFNCPSDSCVAIIEFEPLEDCGNSIECPRCHVEHGITVNQSMREKHIVDRCASCGGSEMFIRKDFPQRFGVAIVVVFGAIAVYYFRISVLLGWAALAAALVIDVAVYLLVGKVTTCYACRAEYRKCVLNPEHEGFDLPTSEKY